MKVRQHFRICMVKTAVAMGLLVIMTSCATSPTTDAENTAEFTQTGYSSFDLENKLIEANEAYDEGQLVDAERLFLNIVFKHRGLSDAWFKLGNIYYRSGRYKASVNAYETVLKIDNDYDKAWYNLGLARLSQSIEVLDNALQNISPSSPYYLRTVSLRNSLVRRSSNSMNRPNEQDSKRSSSPVVPDVSSNKEKLNLTDTLSSVSQEIVSEGGEDGGQTPKIEGDLKDGTDALEGTNEKVIDGQPRGERYYIGQ